MQNMAALQSLQPPNLLQSFQGTWTLRREIINHLNIDLSGTVTGTAEFLPTANPIELGYYESGINSQNNSAEFRVYYESIYRFDSEFKIINLDPKRNIVFEFNLNRANNRNYVSDAAMHLCKADLYTAVLELRGATEFQLNILVKGPNKDYATITVFRK